MQSTISNEKELTPLLYTQLHELAFQIRKSYDNLVPRLPIGRQAVCTKGFTYLHPSMAKGRQSKTAFGYT